MKYYPLLLWGFLPFLFSACTPSGEPNGMNGAATSPPDSAQWIVDQAIARHGGDVIDHSRISFDFRERHYVAQRRGGLFTYERIWQDTTGRRYRDVLTNERLYREIDGERVELTAKDSAAYANSVNSVIYFALLPYFLNDPAVRKTYLGRSSIQGQEYYKIKVTFRREGGGKDYEDEFIYWIRTGEFTLDYLAYNYLTDGGGARFREAYNVRNIKGIRFADYVNYKPDPDNREVAAFDSLFNAGQMEELSRIELEDIQVDVLAEEAY